MLSDYASYYAGARIANGSINAGDKLADSALSDILSSNSAQQGKKIVKVNLAWFIVFGLLGLVYFGTGFAKNKLVTSKARD